MRVIVLVAALVAITCGWSSVVHAQATITVVNLDGTGEGFNDPSPPDSASTAGGNSGSTLGEQRFISFQYAADIWAGLLDSSEEIFVGANFDPLTCTPSSATLGAAGTNTVHRDFAGATVSNTWFTAALANALSGTDLAPSSNDIGAVFNSNIGDTCAFPRAWYYGLDANPPGNAIDFVSIVLHELGHGLGFQTFVDLTTGAKLSSLDDVFMFWLEDHSTGALYPEMTNADRVAASTNTGNLHWTGPDVIAAGAGLVAGRHPIGHVEMYAPNPQEPGLSVSHFSTSLSPDELMEPAFTGVNHDVGLAAVLMQDIGWPTSSPPLAITGASGSIEANSATLNGTVRPNGAPTRYFFEYGTTTAYGSVTPTANAGSGSVDIPVSAAIGGLEPNTTYHFRIVATNSLGTSIGEDTVFVTPTLIRYTLGVDVVGSGRVALNPSGGIYDADTVVALNAAGSGNGLFVGWSGALTGVGNPQSIAMDADKLVTATFIDVMLNSGIQFTNLVAIDPDSISETAGRPTDFLYAMIDLDIEVAATGDTATIVVTFPIAAPVDYNWYKYHSTQGWIPFDLNSISNGNGDGAVFNSDRTQVTVYITDNGPYDENPANRIISDPSGLGKTPVPSASDPSLPATSGGGGGGGGCFIDTVSCL